MHTQVAACQSVPLAVRPPLRNAGPKSLRTEPTLLSCPPGRRAAARTNDWPKMSVSGVTSAAPYACFPGASRRQAASWRTAENGRKRCAAAPGSQGNGGLHPKRRTDPLHACSRWSLWTSPDRPTTATPAPTSPPLAKVSASPRSQARPGFSAENGQGSASVEFQPCFYVCACAFAGCEGNGSNSWIVVCRANRAPATLSNRPRGRSSTTSKKRGFRRNAALGTRLSCASEPFIVC